MKLNKSELVEKINKLPNDQRRQVKQFFENRIPWKHKARPKQLAPDGEWFVWMIRAGRGWGKTRSSAEWLHQRAKEKSGRWMALIGKTPGDARDDCIQGPGGLIQNAPDEIECKYESSKRRITWSNGSYATIYSGANPDQLRGFSGDTAWCDEMAAWEYVEETWSNLMYGMREGDDPRVVISTTPRPVKKLKEIEDKSSTVVITGSSYENKGNLSDRFFESVIEPAEGTEIGQQEIHAEYVEASGLWDWAMIERARKKCPDGTKYNKLVVAIDPAVTSGDDSDETGIIVAGQGKNDYFYIIEDLTMKGSPNSWASQAVNAYHRHQADKVIAETNQGGDMVSRMIQQADNTVPFDEVRATRGKKVRAEPVVAMYERGEVFHVDRFEELEKQMIRFSGESSDDSPDRMDALVWALTELNDNKGSSLTWGS